MKRKQRISLNKQVGIRASELKTISSSKYIKTKRFRPDEYLSNIRTSVPPEFYHEAIEDIEKLPFALTGLLSADVKKSIKDLFTDYLLFVSFESEFSWARNIIIKNINSLQLFINLSSKYSLNILNGDFNKAAENLDVIERNYGQSLWLIKNRISLLQLNSGLEAQKKYTLELKSDLPSGALSRFIIHWISVRNESQTSVTRFTKDVEHVINRLNPQTQVGYKEYLRFHLLAIETLSPEEFCHVLRIDYSHSLIDYYEAFVALIRVISLSEIPTQKARIHFLLRNEKFVIDDKRLVSIGNLVGVNYFNLRKDFMCHDIQQQFLSGDYNLAYRNSLKSLEGNFDDPFLIVMAAYSKGLGDENDLSAEAQNTFSVEEVASLREKIITLITQVIRYGIVQASNEFNELCKINLNFHCFNWSSSILYFDKKENNFFADLTSDCSLIPLKSNYLSPFFLECFQKDSINHEIYSQLCLENDSEDLAFIYYKSFFDRDLTVNISSIEKYHRSLWKSLIHFLSGNYDDCISSANILLESSNGYFVRRAYGLISFSLLRKGELKECVRMTAEFYLKDKDYYYFLPFKEISEAIKSGSKEWRFVCNEIDFPILMDCCFKHVSQKLENERRFAYEDFLISNSMEKPSNLFENRDKYDGQKLVYYLDNICTEATMDTSSSFEGGSKEVVEERIKICRFLTEINFNNDKNYKLEINELIRRQVISSRRQEVDQSRIHVEVDRIKAWAIIELKESYERYLAYLKSGINTLDNLGDNSLIKGEKGRRTDITVPDNEVDELLSYMIEEIADSYISFEFGLDRFLSTRVRHGILENHLRKPIQQHHLITKKITKSGPYLSNDYWLDKLTTEERKYSKTIDKILSKFSEAYDNMIYQISNEFLQVKKEEKPNGLFEFEIDHEFIQNLRSQIVVSTKIDEFVELVLKSLESMLIFNLIKVRDVINSNTKARAKSMLDGLLNSFSSIITSISVDVEREIIQAKTDLQTQFDQVIEWFVPSSSSNTAPYVLEDAVMVAEAIIKDAYPVFSVMIESDEENSLAIHGQLPVFVDIFINIFENVVKRANLEIPTVTVKIDSFKHDYEPDLSFIEMDVINEIGEDIDLVTLDLNLKRKRALLESGEYSKYVATEGNSGLFKIYKSVVDFTALGFSEKANFEFGIQDNYFLIHISIPVRIFTLETDSN